MFEIRITCGPQTRYRLYIGGNCVWSSFIDMTLGTQPPSSEAYTSIFIHNTDIFYDVSFILCLFQDKIQHTYKNNCFSFKSFSA